MSLRDFYILSYAEYLCSDPALWRITIDYMYSCDAIGKQRADNILTHVPLRLRQQNGNSDPAAADRIRSGDIVGVLKEVNEACFQYGREGVRRAVCKVRPEKAGVRVDDSITVFFVRLQRGSSFRKRALVWLLRIARPPRIGPG